VNFISSGALTHSFKSLDISLLFKEGKWLTISQF
jgi:nicotinate-nucleotide pyrophosphorylase